MRLKRRLAHGSIPPRLTAVTAAAVALIVIALVVLTLQGSGNADETGTAALPPAPNHGQGGAGAAAPADSSGATGGAADGTAPGAGGEEDAVAGPITEIDKTFLVAVRRAGLWEIPAGKLAQTNASSEAVKRAGHHLIDGHSKLDQMVREDARILGVEIPDEATEEQQQWVEQMRTSKGEEFDKFFANILRIAHGKIFAVVAQVRAATQNDLIRRHARQANQTVLDHLEVLEDTGLVTRESLAEVEEAVSNTPK